MTILEILAAILLVMVVFGETKVSLQGEYAGDGPVIMAAFGGIKVKLWPRKPRKEKRKDTPEKEKSPKQPAIKWDVQAMIRGGALDYARHLLPIVLEAPSQFQKKLVVDVLHLELYVGVEEPEDIVRKYGMSNAVLGALWAPLTQAFHVKDGTAKVVPDFQTGEMTLYGHIAISIKVRQLLWLGLYFGRKGLNEFLSVSKRRKEVSDDGQAQSSAQVQQE